MRYLQQQQYDVQTKLTNTDSYSNQYLSPQTSQTNLDESSDFLVFTLDKTTFSTCLRGAIISEGSSEGFVFHSAENIQLLEKDFHN